MVVACYNAYGEPDFYCVKVLPKNEDQIDTGELYACARNKALSKGFKEPMVVFDQHDFSINFLKFFPMFEWDTNDASEFEWDAADASEFGWDTNDPQEFRKMTKTLEKLYQKLGTLEIDEMLAIEVKNLKILAKIRKAMLPVKQEINVLEGQKIYPEARPLTYWEGVISNITGEVHPDILSEIEELMRTNLGTLSNATTQDLAREAFLCRDAVLQLMKLKIKYGDGSEASLHG